MIGLPRVRELAARLRRYLDGFAEFPGFPSMAEPGCDLDAVPDFFQRMKSEGFDLAIQMHGSGEIANPLMVLMGAACNAGFYRPTAQTRSATCNGRTAKTRCRGACASPRGALRLENYVCLHCGAQPQRLAELGNALAAEGWNVVLTGDAQVAGARHEPAISLAGRTSLGGTAAVIAKARLLVSTDREVSLIGAAMRTPTLTLPA